MTSRRTNPRKTPSQGRSRALVDAVIDATARVLVSEGEAALTTNRVAEVAGVSVGSLYQYFPNKEALVAAVIERRLARDGAELGAALRLADGLPLREAVRIMAARAVAIRSRERDFYRAVLPLVGQVERDREARRVAVEARAGLTAWLRSRREELRSDLRTGPEADERLDTAVFVATQTIEATLNSAAVEHPKLLDRASLVDALVTVVEALWLPSAPGA